jgi:mRNA-degrading endonuclease RelE of RelBE toxin-antitoxin system
MSYELFIEPEVHAARQALPGHVRQWVRRAISDLARDPRPANSTDLTIDPSIAHASVEIRRIRIERWRVVYAVHDDEQWVWVLGIFRRPPYSYEDLGDLVSRLR